MKLTTEDRKALQDAINVLLGMLQQASPEVPERIEEWPEDDTHLRGEFWKDRQGDVITYTGGGWMFWSERWGQWLSLPLKPGYYLPLTRTTDPSLPSTWDTLEEWPEDDTHLRGEFWKDREGDRFRFSDGRWEMWSPRIRDWVPAGGSPDSSWAPYTRTTDPSLPRTWDTLDDVPEDVERVTGDYVGTRRELARSPLSESGWFQRLKDGTFRNWAELPTDHAKHVKNIKEDQ